MLARDYAMCERLVEQRRSRLAACLHNRSRRVSFWNSIDGAKQPVNALEIVGNVTQGVTLDPATHKSGLIKLATISFTNGDWFGVQPTYDPGLGPLYAESSFAFSQIARPDPFIGTSHYPGYQLLNETLVLTSTFGPATPDLLSFAGSPFLGSVAVDEGATGTFEIWGRIGSLEPVELRNPSASVSLLAAVPEPESYAMLLAGLCLLGFMRRQKNRTAA